MKSLSDMTPEELEDVIAQQCGHDPNWDLIDGAVHELVLRIISLKRQLDEAKK